MSEVPDKPLKTQIKYIWMFFYDQRSCIAVHPYLGVIQLCDTTDPGKRYRLQLIMNILTVGLLMG